MIIKNPKNNKTYISKVDAIMDFNCDDVHFCSDCPLCYKDNLFDCDCDCECAQDYIYDLTDIEIDSYINSMGYVVSGDENKMEDNRPFLLRYTDFKAGERFKIDGEEDIFYYINKKGELKTTKGLYSTSGLYKLLENPNCAHRIVNLTEAEKKIIRSIPGAKYITCDNYDDFVDFKTIDFWDEKPILINKSCYRGTDEVSHGYIGSITVKLFPSIVKGQLINVKDIL